MLEAPGHHCSTAILHRQLLTVLLMFLIFSESDLNSHKENTGKEKKKNLLWKPVKGNSNMKTQDYTYISTQELSRVKERGKSRKSIWVSRTETEKWKRL